MQACWRILDTGFDALRFLQRWQAWGVDPQRSQILHYVALTGAIPDPQTLQHTASLDGVLRALSDEMAVQWVDLAPGFHRFTLARGRVLLTLCIGELRTLLREQQFAADSVYLDTNAPPSWDRWDLKALVRCCRRGTELVCSGLTPELQQGLMQSGFEIKANQAVFNPRWKITTSREPQRYVAALPSSCAVIGAGLAGASVAAALARRGWLVEVFDAATEPAAGASGLPAGLVAPHVSADDSPRSKLSRSGVRLMLQQARDALQIGQEWDQSGVLERRFDGRPDLWHAQACWIKPARLVRQWLSQPGVRFRGQAAVAGLHWVDGLWELRDASGGCLARAEHVVLANASGVQALMHRLDHSLSSTLTQLPELHGLRGGLSWGHRQASQAGVLPEHPVNGNGSLIPAVPTDEGMAWYCGATYEPVTQTSAPPTAQHQTNLDKLRTLQPKAAEALSHSEMQLWQGVRCVSADRMPLAGALQSGDHPTLWISAAMGSRGLSFAVLCAEILAARIGAEPLPVEGSLARFLDPGRRTAAI